MPTSAESDRLLWAPRAWLPEGWHEDVLLRIDEEGNWSEVRARVAPPPQARRIDGALLPGLVDAHSHAFQRAFAGLAERRQDAADTFWSWRDRMYQAALRITPQQLRAVAAMLYLELLHGGYTQVCEFHYLHRDPSGRPYPDLLEMGLALCDAAGQAGIGLTLMPTLYERAGFGQPTLRADQRRFACDAASAWKMARAIGAHRHPLLRAGLAVHSLRAASTESIVALARAADGFDGPIHVHVSEQTAEVDECVAATGKRPIAWLAEQGLLDPRWQLVHATHAAPSEIDAAAAAGAGIVLCPSTEANLGDGVPDLPHMLANNVPITLGSDSQVNRDWREELRWLDYAQRLLRRERNSSAAPQLAQPSTAERLWSRVQAGSGRSAGLGAWGLCTGARADALVLDSRASSLLGIAPAQQLDALVFSSPAPAWRDVLVAGRWVLREGAHPRAEEIAHRFDDAMRELWWDTTS